MAASGLPIRPLPLPGHSTKPPRLANFAPMTDTNDDERLTQLEILAAEQERTIAELSEQVAAQWATIEKMRKKLDMLAERFLALEERSAPDVPVTRPPHW